MKRGEKAVLALIGAVVVAGVVHSELHVEGKHDREIPFYSTAAPDVARKAMDIYHSNGCKSCHTLWTVRDMLQSVPAPMLDGIGSLRTETWLYQYLSSPDPQAILPSRLKKEYRMPSYAGLPDDDRRLLAQYLASLKVKDWYLDQTKQAEYEKLTGMVHKE
ncbi:MAG TPA: cytochrome c [Gallionella sp.]|nr:cytochrome c [Gallionella sp.]